VRRGKKREREREWLPGNGERGDQQYRSLSGHLLRGGLRGWRRQNPLSKMALLPSVEDSPMSLQ